MQRYSSWIGSRFLHLAGILIVALCVTSPQRSRAAAPAPTVAERYITCSRPLLRIGDAMAMQGAGGYGIEIDGERYFFVFDERTTFSLVAADTGAPVAHLKIDRSPSEFSQQAQWRERWMEDIAERSGTALVRYAPSDKVTLLTINKKTLTGKSAGLSVLVDAPNQVFVQWEWDHSARYRGPEDLVAIQAATWKNLIDCLAK